MGTVKNIFLAFGLYFIVVNANHQTYPGTATRPILSSEEASLLTEENYLQGWVPEEINIPEVADYVVGYGEAYTDIQAAVNDAIIAGGTSRKYIEIKPGTYKQTVYVVGNVPLTIYGSGSKSSDVSIILSQPTDMNVNAWIEQVNPNGTRYLPGDPAYSVYNKCASRTDPIGSCSTIFWIQADDIQVYNLQVTNFYSDHGVAQSIALEAIADKIRLSKLNLISRQDTLYVGKSKPDLVQRIYVESSYIEGDVDFVCGGAATIFNNVTFNAVSERHPSGGIIFAPSTDPGNSFGFLVMNSIITGDTTFMSSKTVNLARAWDTGTPAGSYIIGTSPNGQLNIRNTRIDGFINVEAPYATATSSRNYAGNIETNRILDDNNFNRFWEFMNYGDGA